MRLTISDKARADLLRIYRYLDERSPNAANTFIRRINTNFDNLIRFPFIGRERSRLAPGLRCLVVGLHLLFYTIDSDQVIIIRVIDGRMDVDEEFYR
jgi:toxin ParE1/3/4